MSFEIREIQPVDLPAVMELLQEFAEFEQLSEYCTATVESFAAALFGENKIADGLVFDAGGRLCGYAIFQPHFSSFRGERGLYLEDIYIKQEFRGGGLGRRAISQIAKIAAARGFERIDFQVLNWNTTAIDFYRRLGAESNVDETHFKIHGEAFRKLLVADN